MNWQGIPFPFAGFLAENHSYFQIDKLPTIIIDSGFPWENVIGSFIASCIPAVIAWKTIKNNNDLIKRQIFLSAQQRKVEYLREMVTDYISQLELSVHSADVLLAKYKDKPEEIPFEDMMVVLKLIGESSSCATKIKLILGGNHPKYQECKKLMKEAEDKINDAIFEPGNENDEDNVVIDNEKENLVIFFSKILEIEEQKLV
ncbi:hypothetical protein C3408_13205 [Candidatus Pantoea alvi]|uniref:hypothetical protein n=1 Tax=Enterobacter agglomerans TaxID=549 RepID=UPI000CDD4193|nr:hypothetical protein [Pantoea agglomerans]POW56415.1 hypothetical protein C3408_13205 [Pantoea alvi]UBN56098.1 hypothetical protein LB453_11390 [Pantoea agglomerans]